MSSLFPYTTLFRSNSVKAGLQMQTFFQNGDEQIDGDGRPDLGAHRVGRRAVKGFDAQRLLEPFEEEFDLPASPIELGNGQSRHGEVVGQEDQHLAGFGIAIADAAERVGIILLRRQAGQDPRLVATQAGGFVHGPGVAAGAAEVLPGTGDEESAALMEPMESGEVEIAAIHDVERAGFPDELVKEVDIMHAASGDDDDGGKVALEGQQGVEFDGGFGAAEGGPRKEREAEVNGGGVQRISRRLEFKAKGFIRVERGGLLDQDVGEVGKDTPVPLFIGHRQRVAGGGLAAAGVIEFGAEGGEAGCDVAQTFAPGQLGEGQHEELFVGGQPADAKVAVVTGDTLVKLVLGQEVEELGEDGATFVHKVKNRWPAVKHPRGVVAELKSKNDRTTKKRRFYQVEIVVIKTLTGQ